MKAKLGPAAGITATAHKIAIIFYTLVTKQIEYDCKNWPNRRIGTISSSKAQRRRGWSSGISVSA